MASTIRLNDDDIALAKQAAQINNRSTAGQIAHWMTIGRIIEQSPSYSHERVKSALSAELAYDDLSAEEQDVFLEQFHENMRNLSAADEAAFLEGIDEPVEPTRLGLFDDENMNALSEAMQNKDHHDALTDEARIKSISEAGMINVQGERGFTLLMWSVLCERPLVARTLIEAGASLSVPDEAGNSPLHVAARMERTLMLKTLIEAMGQMAVEIVNTRTALTPLMEAVSSGHADNALLLINAGTSLDHQDLAGNTALHFATGYAMAKLASTMIKAGASPFIKNNGGVTFYDLMKAQHMDSASADYRALHAEVLEAIDQFEAQENGGGITRIAN